MVIDGHCHIGPGIKRHLTADELLRAMDGCGVDKAVICPTDEFIAVLNHEGNDYVIDAVRNHPGRFIGFAAVNPWFGPKAVDELRRSLDRGLKGLKLNPAIQGFFANDEIVFPIIEVANEFGVPVYCHTGTPIHALPLQVADLAIRFPTVNFIMGHMGAADFSYEVIPAMTTSKNLFAETSKFSDFNIVKEVISKFGASRVIFGSDLPTSLLGLELEKIRLLNLNQEQVDWVLGKTVLSLTG